MSERKPIQKKKINRLIPSYQTGISRANQVAKMLVNRFGVRVVEGQHPCVDLKTNTIYLPPYDVHNEKDVENMLHYVAHEVGHIEYSDETELRGIKFKFLNILEDQRVNAKQEYKYSGLDFKVVYDRILDKTKRANDKVDEKTDKLLEQIDAVAGSLGLDADKMKANQEAAKNLNIFMSGLLLKCSDVSRVVIKDTFVDKDWLAAFEEVESILNQNWLNIPSSSLLEDDSETIYKAIEHLIPENFENEMTSDGAHVVPMTKEMLEKLKEGGSGGDSEGEGSSSGEGGDAGEGVPLKIQGGSHSGEGMVSQELGEQAAESSLSNGDGEIDSQGNNSRSYGTAETDQVFDSINFTPFSSMNSQSGWRNRGRLEIRSKPFYNKFLDIFITEDEQEYDMGYSKGRLRNPEKIYTCRKPFSKVISGVSHEKVSVTLLIDFSGSMDGYTKNVAEVVGGIAMATSKLRIPLQAFGYEGGWGGTNVVELIPLGTGFTSSMANGLFSMQAGGGTPTGESLSYVFHKHVVPKKGTKKLIFLITDGYPNNGDYAKMQIDMVKKYRDVKLSGIGIGYDCERLLNVIPDALLIPDHDTFRLEGQMKFFRDLERFFLTGLVA